MQKKQILIKRVKNVQNVQYHGKEKYMIYGAL